RLTYLLRSRHDALPKIRCCSSPLPWARMCSPIAELKFKCHRNRTGFGPRSRRRLLALSGALRHRKNPVFCHMACKAERVVAHPCFGGRRIARFERGEDGAVVAPRNLEPAFLADRDRADGAHVQKEIA